MERFISKLILFLTIAILAVLSCQILAPISAFIYRPWEGLVFSKIPSSSPFYPNSTLSMRSVGDLCHHTENSVTKNEYWEIDELGYRNNKYIKSSDILIIGDSYIAGSGLTQDDILSNQISKIDDTLKVYSLAPSSMSDFDRLLKTEKIARPKKLIFSIAERKTPEIINYYSPNSSLAKIVNIASYKNMNAFFDKLIKVYPLKWIKARALSAIGLGIQGINSSQMYFFQGFTQKHEKEDLLKTVSTIVSYKNYCDSLKIEFLFLPMPDKETVYYEFVPFAKQPDYLIQLDSLLKIADVKTINTLKIYNAYRSNNDKLLYHLDDTHWNSTATKIVAKEIIRAANE